MKEKEKVLNDRVIYTGDLNRYADEIIEIPGYQLNQDTLLIQQNPGLLKYPKASLCIFDECYGFVVTNKSHRVLFNRLLRREAVNKNVIKYVLKKAGQTKLFPLVAGSFTFAPLSGFCKGQGCRWIAINRLERYNYDYNKGEFSFRSLNNNCIRGKLKNKQFTETFQNATTFHFGLREYNMNLAAQRGDRYITPVHPADTDLYTQYSSFCPRSAIIKKLVADLQQTILAANEELWMKAIDNYCMNNQYSELLRTDMNSEIKRMIEREYYF